MCSYRVCALAFNTLLRKTLKTSRQTSYVNDDVLRRVSMKGCLDLVSATACVNARLVVQILTQIADHTPEQDFLRDTDVIRSLHSHVSLDEVIVKS